VIKLLVTISFLRIANHSFVGNSTYRINTRYTVEQCEWECRYDSRCYGYLLYNGGSCLLKSRADEFKMFDVTKTTIAGIKLTKK